MKICISKRFKSALTIKEVAQLLTLVSSQYNMDIRDEVIYIGIKKILAIYLTQNFLTLFYKVYTTVHSIKSKKKSQFFLFPGRYETQKWWFSPVLTPKDYAKLEIYQ